MTNQFPINSLNYDDIKNNFITYLKSQKDSNGQYIYEDYDFQASGISTLLNLLSYNTHYIGYYIKMLLNESFIDSSVKKESLFSKSKLVGYIPQSKTSSKLDIQLIVDLDVNQQPSSQSIFIPKGTSFSGSNSSKDQRLFYTIDNIFIKNIEYPSTGIARYVSDVFTVYEGSIQEYKFKMDSQLDNQRFVIKDKNIDIDTLRIYVTEQSSTNTLEYKLSKLFDSIDSNSLVFYLSTNENGFYEIVFGNNVFGSSPSNESIIFCTYIKSNGQTGNGCRKVVFNAPQQDIPTEYNIGNWEDFTVKMVSEVSYGGGEGDTVDSLRFNIPNHNKRQNRLLTESDYRSIILEKFNNIESINVWGGEKNYVKDYGKVYISIKPKYSDKLTDSAKYAIKNKLLKEYGSIGIDPVFVDPQFINIDLEIRVKVDHKNNKKTLGELEKDIITIINEYNLTTLNVFDNFYSDVSLMNSIKESNKAIRSCYSNKTIDKDITVYYQSGIENVLFFGNEIDSGVESSSFLYGDNLCKFKDDDGLLYIYKFESGKYEKRLLPMSFGQVKYLSGIIYFKFPEVGVMQEKDYGDYGIINFKAAATNADLETIYQNIVRISKVRVLLS